MTSPPLVSGSGNARRGVVLAAGAAWISVLAALVFTSSNPVIVNRTQVLSSSVIAIGHRNPAKPDEFVITKLWLGKVPEERITVREWPEIAPEGDIVVPLMRVLNNEFRITQGELPNPPVQIGQPAAKAVVRPLVYPATQDVLDQLTSLVGPPAAR